MNSPLIDFKDQTSRRPKPFIGHIGLGSRLICTEENSRLIIRETLLSQLVSIVTLFLIGPGVNLIFYFNREQILRKPMFVVVAVTVFSLVGWIFGAKYLLRLIRDRRIEINSNGSVYLFESNQSVFKEIAKANICRHEIFESIHRNGASLISNYSLRLTLKNDESVFLCTTDSKKNIQSIYEQFMVYSRAQ